MIHVEVRRQLDGVGFLLPPHADPGDLTRGVRVGRRASSTEAYPQPGQGTQSFDLTTGRGEPLC